MRFGAICRATRQIQSGLAATTGKTALEGTKAAAAESQKREIIISNRRLPRHVPAGCGSRSKIGNVNSSRKAVAAVGN